LGGIWEINFSLPPKGAADCKVPDGAVDGRSVGLVVAVRCQQFVEYGGRGVWADRRPLPE
jgi:hypothetical protein